MPRSDPPDNEVAVRRLAAIVEYSDDAIISKDVNGIVTSWNRAAERMFGHTAAEMIGQSITTIVPKDRLAEEALVLGKIRAGEAVANFETIRVHKDGTLIPISLTVSPIRAHDGTVVGASKIARDITERRRAEQALADADERQQRLQRRLMALISGAGSLFEFPEGSAVLPASIELAQSLVDADGYAIWRFEQESATWSVAAAAHLSESFTGRMITSYQGRVPGPVSFVEPLAVEDVGTHHLVNEHLDTYQQEGIQSLLAVPLIIRETPSGTLVFYYRRRHVFDASEVQIAKAIGALTAAALTTAELYDAQRRSRDEAARAYRHASEANRAKDEFLATLSHEIRTPLNAVLGWTRMLRAGAIAPGRIPRAFEVIERNAEAQLRLVEDMLDLSRIITGNLRLDVQPVEVSQTIAAAVETVMPAARAKEITIAIDADKQAVIAGDPARLQQVVWNLLSNAVKFTPRGGSIAVTASADNSAVQMTVADNGEGIEPDVLPYVFDRFKQGDSGTTRTQMGLGLGLAIVRHITEMHGGRVSARSAGKGQGATFSLLFPTAADQERVARSAAAAPARFGSPAAQALAGIRALVVDDDPDARELLTVLLEARGVQVRTAASAAEGLALFDREPPDIVLSDLVMPDRDGHDFIRSVRARSAAAGGLVPAIAISAYAGAAASARSGYQVHLNKPIDPSALYSAIERLALEHRPRVAE
jgi:PAS domain S-box-containing protein